MRLTKSVCARFLALALLALGTVGIAACGSQGEGATASAESSPATVKVVVGEKMLTLDPNSMFSEQDWFVSGLYGGTLTEFPSGKPELAESVTHSSNYLTWTFQLRKGLKFSNGSPLTAKDVEASFDHILNEEEAFPNLYIPGVQSVKAKGAQTVVFSLDEPSYTLAQMVSASMFEIFPASGLAEGAQFFRKPISAGRFQLDTWSPRSVKLSANPNYYGGPPQTQTVEFSVTEDPGTRLAEVKTGQANYAFDLPATLSPQISGGDVRPEVTKQAGTYQLLFNNKSPLLSDPKIRRAISLALDREAVDATVFSGQATAMSRFWPKTVGYFDETGQETSPDVAAAKRELKGTKCESGCTIELLGRSSNPWVQPMALVLQQNLQEIGIELDLNFADFATVSKREENFQYEIMPEIWAGYINLPEAFMTLSLQPSGPVEAGFSGYKSAKMDSLIREMIVTPVNQRAGIAEEIDDLYVKDQPFATVAEMFYLSAANLPASTIHGEMFNLWIH